MSPDSLRDAASTYLDERVRFGIKLGLEITRALLAEFDHPEGHAPVLLVAGTNGKGSVASYVASALRATGLRTGLYTSPHLLRVNERIAVDGRPIQDEALFRAVLRVREGAAHLVRAGRIADHPTYFETLTVAAFDHFRAAEVDVSVVEVGLGGRYDATNTCEPAASAIVSIDFDHEAYLGPSLSAIASEKAGILRPGRTTVLGSLGEEARTTVEGEAERVGARLVRAEEGSRIRPLGERVEIRTPRRTYRGLRPLPGAHQRQNLLVALRLLEEAEAAGIPVDWGRVPAAIEATVWPGRLQRIDGAPSLLLDGAHNPAGAQALAAYLDGSPPFVLLFGVMRDKGIGAMAQALFPSAAEVVLTQPREGRAADPASIMKEAGPCASRAHITDCASSGLALARRLARSSGLVVVAGSLYLVGEVLELLDVGKGPRLGI